MSAAPLDSAKGRQVDLDLQIQIERAHNLQEKCAQSDLNLDKLRQLMSSISEEICMTLEDMEG